jgi:hypothetical protein
LDYVHLAPQPYGEKNKKINLEVKGLSTSNVLKSGKRDMEIKILVRNLLIVFINKSGNALVYFLLKYKIGQRTALD